MILLIENDKLLVESVSSEEEKELREFAKSRIHLTAVKADFRPATDSHEHSRNPSMDSEGE